MIRICAVSDLHGTLPEIEPSDILLLGGDICIDDTPFMQAKWLREVFGDWLEKIPAKEVVGVAGNHDLVFQKIPELVPKFLRWHYLEHNVITIEGVKIFGSPWILPVWGAFECDEEGLKRKYAQIPDDTDIIISHCPPFGIGDLAPGFISNNLEHCGSISLRGRLWEIMPVFCCWGHIHNSRGVWKHGWSDENSMVLANVSCKPMTFDLDIEKRLVKVIHE